MAKKVKQHSQKSLKKTILKDIEGKLEETLKEYRKKVSDKKFKKSLRKAGKILGNSVTIESIAVVPKKQPKTKKTTNAAQAELVS